MSVPAASETQFVDASPEEERLLLEIVSGLSRRPRRLPCKLFYDERGSQLFDSICELDEYYPTRTEASIIAANVEEMAACFPPDSVMVEYGSGSSIKTCLLLDHLLHLRAYVPLDISREHLIQSAERLRQRYANLRVIPLCADYTADAFPELPEGDVPRVVFFPGSTIGNFEPAEAVAFLGRIRRVIGDQGGLLIGVDLRKDPVILERAYNDSAGVTAEFNLNALRHINRRFGGNFVLQQYRHHALFNAELSRIEMHLISRIKQSVRVADREVTLEAGESIHTESSYKYTLEHFAETASRAGLEVKRVWTDPASLFSVQYLVSR